MYPDTTGMLCLLGSLALVASSEAFFLKWGSDSTRPLATQKTWVQPSMTSSYRYQYPYFPYESRKSMSPIPISVPAGASLTPVSLQHVQLVPCMCPVAPEEAEKLQEQVGLGPYLAQAYPAQTYQAPSQPAYSIPQQMPAAASEAKPTA